ncbi:uncharacterized protein [Symphalangus syndactylus]|uniref:uncharacterized protein isoform X2 n=1 Tax=Symphalangus syndactylus TaxID=9590 RepID=UPI003007889B
MAGQAGVPHEHGECPHPRPPRSSPLLHTDLITCHQGQGCQGVGSPAPGPRPETPRDTQSPEVPTSRQMEAHQLPMDGVAQTGSSGTQLAGRTPAEKLSAIAAAVGQRRKRKRNRLGWSLCPQDPAASSSSWLQGVLVSEERQAGVPRGWLGGAGKPLSLSLSSTSALFGFVPTCVAFAWEVRWRDMCTTIAGVPAWGPRRPMAFPEGSSAIGQLVSGCCTGLSPPSALACRNQERVGSSCIANGLKPLICTLANG